MSSKASKTASLGLAAALAAAQVAPSAVAGGYEHPPRGSNSTQNTIVDSKVRGGDQNTSVRGGDQNVRGGDQRTDVRVGGQNTAVRGGDQNVRVGDQKTDVDVNNKINTKIDVDTRNTVNPTAIAGGGGGGAGGAGGEGGDANIDNSGNSKIDNAGNSKIDNSGNSQARGGDQQQGQNFSDNRSETTTYTVKHKVGLTSEAVRADGACKKGFSIGVGGDFGFSGSAVDTNTKCLDKVQGHEKEMKILEQGPEGALYVIKKDSLESRESAEAFNTVGEAHFKATQTKGAGRPSLGELWQSSRPSIYETAEQRANRATGRDVRVSAPAAPAPGWDR